MKNHGCNDGASPIIFKEERHKNDVLARLEKTYGATDGSLPFEERLKEISTIAFMLLSRCGADMDEWRGELDFHYISEFNTPGALSVMGNAAMDLCRPVLMEIGRAVAQSERRREKGRTRNKEKESVNGGHMEGAKINLK